MKHFKLLFVTLAIVGLGSSAMAQSTYSIGKSGSQYQIYKDGSTFYSSPFIQTAIDFIREDVNDAGSVPCIIQFGIGDGPYSVLDLGGGNATVITFENTLSQKWGKITLTGKATSACATTNGIILIKDPVSVECKAEITATANGPFLFRNFGTLTISGGKISVIGCAVDNDNNATLTITGGEILGTGKDEYTIWNEGTLTISGGAISATGANGYAVYNNTGTVTISGGEISATSSSSIAVFNHSSGDLTISGGTISAKGDGNIAVINANSGNLTISGGTILSTDAGGVNCGAVVNNGTTTISGGDISVSGTGGSAVYNGNGTTTINDGTISATGTGGYAVFNENGTTTINKGNISATGNSGCAVGNDIGELIINGGDISATVNGTFAIFNNSKVTINGGKISGSGTGTLMSFKCMILNAAFFDMKGGTIECTSDYGNTICNIRKIEISGGTVTSKGGEAIINSQNATVNPELIITGNAKVLAQEGFAVANEKGYVTVMKNSIVFANGADDKAVIAGGYDRQNNAVVASWNNLAGATEYAYGSSQHIFKLPDAATAIWDKQGSDNGISIKYGGTEGFIPIPGVTVTGVGIAETDNDNTLRIFPNPTTGEFRIENGELKIENVEIFDVMGQSVGANLRVRSDNTINISHLPTGVYFVKITTETGVVTKKVIKSEP